MAENNLTTDSLWDEDELENREEGAETEEDRVAREEAEREGRETEDEKLSREAEEAEEERLKAEKGSPEEDQATGIEQFLSQYGISGGIVTFTGTEEGDEPEQKHFNELTPEEQFNVLSDLANSGAPDLESKYGLDENEIGLLNYVRTFSKENDGASVEDAINSMAQDRVDKLMALRESSDIDFTKMSNDAIVTRWLKDTNPDATEEEVSEELERSKNSKFFESQANTIRTNYLQEQVSKQNASDMAYSNELEAIREEDRSTIATAVSDIDNVVGFKIDDASKNEVLAKILEVNSHGDSLFMEEVFSDPSRLFKASWLYYNAEAILDQMDKSHNRALANEYAKGKAHALNGLPSNPVGGVNGGKPSGSNNNDGPSREEKTTDLDNLWDREDD